MSPTLHQRQYLDTMGITVWERRSARGTVTIGAASQTREHLDVQNMGLGPLEAHVSGCQLCPLARARTQTVFGVGAADARCMVIGEAPGADEDRQGEPFVGRAGRLLNAMLRAIGLERDEVYIANIIKCRPPKNRDPKPEEVAACAPYLRRQIELVDPALILAVGRVAAQSLLGTGLALGRMRGKDHSYQDTGVPVIVTYHPAYLLRTPEDKRKVWDDLKRARRLLQAKG